MYIQEIYIKKGWNVVSFYLLNIDFSDIINNPEIIQIRSKNKTYNKKIGAFLSNLKDIDNCQAYWVESTSNFKLVVSGEILNLKNLDNLDIYSLRDIIKQDKEYKFSKLIKLEKGWNQLSFDVFKVDFDSLIQHENLLEIRTLQSSYNKKIPYRFNSLKSIEVESAYFIKTDKSFNLTVSGYFFDYNYINKNYELEKLGQVLLSNNFYSEINIKDLDLIKYLENVYQAKITKNGVKVNLDIVKLINLSESQFSSDEELNYFFNLKILNLNDTKIKKLELNIPNLEEIYCNNTKISKIDLAQNIKLKVLECKNSLLKELNIFQNKEIKYVNTENSRILEIIYVKDLSLPSVYNWKKSPNTKYSLKPIKISDYQFIRLLKTYTYLTYENELVYINVSDITKIDIPKYYKDNNINNLDCIKNLSGIENFVNLEVLNVNNTKGIKELNLNKNVNLKILNAQNSEIESILINENSLLEKINLENTNISNIKLPTVSKIIDTKNPIFESTKNNGIFNTEEINFVGRIANEHDIYEYKSFYLGFNFDLKTLYKNNLDLYQKKLNKVDYIVINFNDIIKDNYLNMFEGLPFQLKVYQLPSTLNPIIYNFKYSNKYTHYPLLISDEKISIWEVEFSYLVKICFNYPIDEEYFYYPKINFIEEPKDNTNYNFYVYYDENFFKKYDSIYYKEFNHFKVSKEIYNISNKHRVYVGNANLDLLNINNCKSKNIDVTKYPFLKTLNLKNNEIENINLDYNTLLRKINISKNLIKSANFKNNKNLEEIYISNNFLQEIDLTNNVKLKILDVSSNILDNLEISENILLKTLNCSHNKISYLNVDKNVNLEKLICFANYFTKINIKNNKKLVYTQEDFDGVDVTDELIEKDNKITNLDLKIYNELFGENIKTSSRYLLNKLAFKVRDNINESLIPIENSVILIKDSYEIFVADKKIFSEKRIGLGYSKYEFSVNTIGKTKMFQNSDNIKFYLLANLNTVSKNLKYLKIKNKFFMEYLIKLGGKKYKEDMVYIDVNNVLHIDISYNENIDSIDEIKHFPNLVTLNCKCCFIENLDVSKNKELIYLKCSDNNIKSINLSENKKLMVLFISNTLISNLDLSNNRELIYINCNDNNNLNYLNLNNYNNKIIEKFKCFKCYNIKTVQLDSYKNNYSLPRNCLYVEKQFHSFLIQYFESYYDNENNLKNDSIDKNIKEIKTFLIKNEKFKNLKGIEDFKSIENLFIDCTPIEEVNLKMNENLKRLSIVGTNMKNLDLTQNTELESIIIIDNPYIESINICNENNDKIDKLKIESCPNLETILIDKRSTVIPSTWEVDSKVKYMFCEKNEIKLFKTENYI